MKVSARDNKVTIIGAGLGGCLMAIYMAKRGYDVEVYERRGDMRSELSEGGRSINMTLAERGLRALEEAGALDEVLELTVTVKGRMVHGLDGSRDFQPYGKDDHEVLHAIMRTDLNTKLLTLAESYPNVKLIFNARCVSIDKQTGIASFKDERHGRQFSTTGNRIIGADGTFSTVRQQIQRNERADYQQEFLHCGYKELRIPPGPGGSFVLEKNALHVWPRGDRMLLAIPNRDGSFTCTCIMPYTGATSFESIKTPEAVIELFKSHFPDALPLIPGLVADFLGKPPADFITTYTFPWYHRDRVVLLGDACHSVVPFYGQGMNAAFEDGLVLSQCIARHEDDWQAAFCEFQELRKPNTDVLARLSQDNFTVLCKKTKSPYFMAHKKFDTALSKLLPGIWVPLYTLISHTTMPYKDAVARARKQERIARLLGMDIILLLMAAAALLTNSARGAVGALQRTFNPEPLRLSLYRSNISQEEASPGD